MTAENRVGAHVIAVLSKLRSTSANDTSFKPEMDWLLALLEAWSLLSRTEAPREIGFRYSSIFPTLTARLQMARPA